MIDRFAACLAETLKHEGGYSNDPHDPGGATMKGVTQRVYDGYRSGQGAAHRDVREITDKELRALYGKNYWGAARCGELPAGVDLVVFDAAVNSGVSRSAKFVQKVTNSSQDGHIGAATLAAINAADPATVVRGMMAERRVFLQKLPTFWRFGKGWMARCDAIEKAALGMCGMSQTDVSAVTISAPLPDADAQSATQGRATAPDPKPPILTEALLGTTGLASSAGGFANGFAKVGAMKAPTLYSVALAFLSEPLVLTGIVTVFAAVTTFLWRRKHA